MIIYHEVAQVTVFCPNGESTIIFPTAYVWITQSLTPRLFFHKSH